MRRCSKCGEIIPAGVMHFVHHKPSKENDAKEENIHVTTPPSVIAVNKPEQQEQNHVPDGMRTTQSLYYWVVLLKIITQFGDALLFIQIAYNIQKYIMRPFDHINVPEFREFIATPRNSTCLIVDSTRLMVELLGGIHPASTEFGDSSLSSKMLLDGKYALVMRYQREKDGQYRPVCTLGFNANEDGIQIRQIQGSNDKKVAFRFHSSFNTTAFLLKLIEESFLKKNIPVHAVPFPQGLEDASYSSRASERYEIFRTGIEGLKIKYSKIHQ